MGVLSTLSMAHDVTWVKCAWGDKNQRGGILMYYYKFAVIR